MTINPHRSDPIIGISLKYPVPLTFYLYEVFHLSIRSISSIYTKYSIYAKYPRIQKVWQAQSSHRESARCTNTIDNPDALPK